MSKTTLYILTGLLAFAASCKPKAMSAEKLSEYVAEPDHGLSQLRKSGEIEMKLTYRPAPLIAMQEAGENHACDSVYQAAIGKYKRYYYFVLEVKTADGRDPVYRGNGGHAQFSERLQKLAFHMGEYMYATTGSDTIRLADSYFPNLYGMGGSTQVLLSFARPQKENKEQVEVIIEEMGFGTGRQKFIFGRDDLNHTPDIICE